MTKIEIKIKTPKKSDEKTKKKSISKKVETIKVSNKETKTDKSEDQSKVKKQKKRWKKKPSITSLIKNTVIKEADISSNWAKLLKQKKIKVNKKLKEKPQKIEEETITETESQNFIKPEEIWFDDVDEILLDSKHVASTAKLSQHSGDNSLPDADKTTSSTSTDGKLVKDGATDGVTNTIAMDCEMVGVGEGGVDSILARCSLVNQYGKCIYDVFVKPTEKVTDYRTHVSGVRSSDLVKGVEFSECQKKVADFMKGRILVGHAIQNDLKVLFLDHPRKRIRDTSKYKPFRALFKGKNPSLKKLTIQVLGVKVQAGEHSSIQDAQATMRLYTFHKNTWEKSLKAKKKETSENK